MKGMGDTPEVETAWDYGERVTERLNALRDRVTELEKALEKIMAHEDNLYSGRIARAALALRAETERQQSYVKVADQVEKELRAEIERLNLRLIEWQRDNLDLRERLKEYAAMFTPDWEAHGDPKQQLTALRAEVGRHKQACDGYLEHAAALRAEVGRLKGPQHTPERYDEIESLRAELLEQEEENSVLRAEVERLREEPNSYIDEIERLRARVAELEEAVKIAQGNTDAAIEDYNDALARIRQLENGGKE